jgi:hypothetical protein
MSLLLCFVPTIGYAVAAYLAVSCLEWSLMAALVLFAAPSILWTAAMWNGNRWRRARKLRLP